MSSVGYHEPVEELSDETRDTRAQPRRGKKEHAAMVLEWIHRHDGALSKELKQYLFSNKPIAHG